MEKGCIKIIFTDTRIQVEKLLMYTSDAKGQRNPNSPISLDSTGIASFDFATLNITRFPYPLYLFDGSKQVGSILILNKDMQQRMVHTENEIRNDYKTLVYTIEPSGLTTPSFLAEKETPPSPSNTTSTMPTTTDPVSKPTPTKLRGKVADIAARIIPRNVQIVFFGKLIDDTKTLPVGLTTTDNYGNFSIDYIKGNYTQVYAVISSSPDEQVTINLNPDGSLPDFTLLIMQELDRFSDQKEHDDCACHSNGNVPRLPDEQDLIGSDSYTQDIGGACVNFTTPNRALEEFKYYKIVRTTDPEVKDTIPFFSSQTEMRNSRLWDGIGSCVQMIYYIAKFKNPLVIFQSPQPVLKVNDQKELESILNAILVSPTTKNKLTDFFSPALLKDSGLEDGHEYWQTAMELRRSFELIVNRVSTRREISASTAIDWDDTPTTYQATTVAHGHVLEFRQVWRADGYSMGDLLYSLPLAPGQKKQIVIYDWTRKESASRSEELSMSEELENDLASDRDINEIVSSVINESTTGSSHVQAHGRSGGMGAGLGAQASGKGWSAVLGISGGYSKTNSDMSSTASQQSSRDVSANSMQQIHDQTKQSASAVRNQRSTVVTTATQGETMNITTEVIANHNHCHAITMQYFEVLRHFALHTELADAQECLFIPLDVTPFDDKKVLRWEHILRRGVPRQLQKGFDAVRRYSMSNGQTTHSAYDIFPPDSAPGIFSTYGDLAMENVSLEFRFEMSISRPAEIKPPDTESLSSLIFGMNEVSSSSSGIAGPWHSIDAAQLEAAGKAISIFAGGTSGKQTVNEMLEERRQKALLEHHEDELNWEKSIGFIPGWRDIRRRVLSQPSNQRDMTFQKEMLNCEWYRHYVQTCLQPCGISGFLNLNQMGLTLTVFSVDKPQQNKTINKVGVWVQATGQTSLKRNQMHSFWLRENDAWQLPPGSSIQVMSGSMRYTNKFISRTLFRVGRQAVDFARNAQLANGATTLSHATHCYFATPLDAEEQRSPKREDLELRSQFLDMLNNELIKYHHLLWTFMDGNQRYMMLDGFQVKAPGRKYWTTKTVNGQTQTIQETEPDTYRSIASVIENRLIGVVGNTIIMPVARGYNLDPKFRWDEDEVTLEDGTKVSKLLHHYMPGGGFKSTPYRISVPTKGVFAEAVMGACNSCEKKDDTRFWRWEESPIDEPTAIEPVSTGSRRSDPGDLTAKDFAQPIVNIQNAPAMPDPTGLGASLELLGKSGLFKDITGLEGNQKGTIDMAKLNQQAAMHYADNAKELAMQQQNTKNSDKIQDQINNSNLPQAEKDALTKAHIEKQIGLPTKGVKEAKASGAEKRQSQIIEKFQAAAKGKIKMLNDDGSGIDAEIEEQPVMLSGSAAAATMILNKEVTYEGEAMIVMREDRLPTPGGPVGATTLCTIVRVLPGYIEDNGGNFITQPVATNWGTFVNLMKTVYYDSETAPSLRQYRILEDAGNSTLTNRLVTLNRIVKNLLSLLGGNAFTSFTDACRRPAKHFYLEYVYSNGPAGPTLLPNAATTNSVWPSMGIGGDMEREDNLPGCYEDHLPGLVLNITGLGANNQSVLAGAVPVPTRIIPFDGNGNNSTGPKSVSMTAMLFQAAGGGISTGIPADLVTASKFDVLDRGAGVISTLLAGSLHNYFPSGAIPANALIVDTTAANRTLYFNGFNHLNLMAGAISGPIAGIAFNAAAPTLPTPTIDPTRPILIRVATLFQVPLSVGTPPRIAPASVWVENFDIVIPAGQLVYGQMNIVDVTVAAPVGLGAGVGVSVNSVVLPAAPPMPVPPTVTGNGWFTQIL